MTKVCFRWMEEHPEVAAVFPEIQWDNWPTLACYCSYEGHGGCTADWVRHETRPATPEEYAPLLEELRRIGYDDLVIVPRMPRVPNRFYGV